MCCVVRYVSLCKKRGREGKGEEGRERGGRKGRRKGGEGGV